MHGILPQQHQGHTLALQFGGDIGPVGLMEVAGWTAHSLEKCCFQRGVIIAPKWQWPAVQPSLSCTKQICRHRCLAELEPKPDLTHGQTLFMRQP